MEVYVRMQTALRLTIGTALVFALATPAATQGTAQPGGILLGAGVSFLVDSESTAKGFSVNVNKDIRSQGKIAVGLAGDFGWHKLTESAEGIDASATVTSFLVGPRITSTANETFSPFGQFMVGFGRVGVSVELDGEDLGSVSGSGFGFSIGGGLNLKTSDRVNFLVQVDYVRFTIEIEGESASGGVTRFLLGISTRLGK